MSLSDPIGDMIARVKNAQARNHKKVELPSSKFKTKIADILKNEGFIKDFKINEEDKKPILLLELKYHSGSPVISAFERVSKESERRLYVLGIMSELGENASSFHESIAKTIKPRNGDRMILIGNSKLTEAYEKGAKSAGWDDSMLESFLAIELCNLDFSQFTGAIFLKGSRSCQLEALIPMFH